MAGLLEIHSQGDAILGTESGHSWIVYTRDGQEPVTFGTWGNNPNHQGNGLHVNLEKDLTSQAARTQRITDEQERALLEKIKEYRDDGAGGWGLLYPCSTFAADAWETATGEVLDHRSGPISNPKRLKESIQALQNGVSPPPQRSRTGSSRSVSSCVQNCGGSSASSRGTSPARGSIGSSSGPSPPRSSR